MIGGEAEIPTDNAHALHMSGEGKVCELIDPLPMRLYNGVAALWYVSDKYAYRKRKIVLVI